MPTHGTESNGGLGAAAKQVAEHASSLARLELELAKLEIGRKVAALGIGIGLGLGAALFVLFAIGFLLALAGLLGVLALGSIKKGTPPVPKQAIEEAKLTSAALKSDGSR